MVKDWIKAFRLRTLPLAFSSIITGTALAFDEFDSIIFFLALATTLFLQVLSNLANDYGDAEKGTDNENRVGPERAIQSGAISKSQMKNDSYSTFASFICSSKVAVTSFSITSVSKSTSCSSLSATSLIFSKVCG